MTIERELAETLRQMADFIKDGGTVYHSSDQNKLRQAADVIERLDREARSKFCPSCGSRLTEEATS